MSNAKIVPATSDILNRFYGEPQKKTVRAVAIVKGEDVLGVGGFYVDEARVVMFSDLKPEALKHKKAVVLGTYEILRAAGETGLPAHAVADSRVPGSEHFLEQLGFESLHSGVWEWRKS